MSIGAGVKQRMYFFDNLRAFIILSLVVFHVAMGYTTWDLNWWYVNDIQKSKIFDFFILGIDVYVMPIMFLIAGYFASPVLLHKGTTRFWGDKLRRIVVPWVAGVLFIAPAIAYSAIFSRTDTPPNYFSFWANDFWGNYYQQAHYWFLGILALFFLLFTIAYKLIPPYFKQIPRIGMPSSAFFLSFVLLSAVPFFGGNLIFGADEWVNCKFIFMIQPVRIGLYACYFGLGVFAWKKAWFTPEGYKPRLIRWGTATIIMLFVFLAYRVTFTLGANIPVLFKAGHALIYACFCLTVTLAFIALFQRFFDSNTYLWRRLAANSYTIYFIHQCVIIPLAYMVQKIQLNIWMKFLGVAVTAMVVCFLIAEYVIRPLLLPEKKTEE
jgi:glucans biosynthesis protein C